MRSFIKNREGSILPMFAVVVSILIMVMAVAIDFSRYNLATEKLQVATDSAAVAAAMSARRYVKIEVDPGKHRVRRCNSEGKCRWVCVRCREKFTVSGLEEELIENRGYKKYCCECGCGGVKLLDRWVVYEDSGAGARAAARMFFNLNKPEEMNSSEGGESYITSIDVYNGRSSPLYPSVVVHSQGRLKTLLLNFIDKTHPESRLSQLNASRCAQGGTFYYDTNRKLHRAAMEGCD